MKKLSILAASALLVAGFASTAMATDFFRSADSNNDGAISMAEAMGTYSTLNIQLFDKVDANGDGWLTEGEFYELGGLTAGQR
jgi:hypothetical protein